MHPFHRTIITNSSSLSGFSSNSYGHGLDGYNLLRDQTQQHFPGSDKFDNFTCGRIDLMGNIVTKSAPYLYPFVIEFSLIVAAILFVMWCRIGKNPRWEKQSLNWVVRKLFLIDSGEMTSWIDYLSPLGRWSPTPESTVSERARWDKVKLVQQNSVWHWIIVFWD